MSFSCPAETQLKIISEGSLSYNLSVNEISKCNVFEGNSLISKIRKWFAGMEGVEWASHAHDIERQQAYGYGPADQRCNIARNYLSQTLH